VSKLLFSCTTCDTEVRNQNSLVLEPSLFVCCVYRLSTCSLTEGDLQDLLSSQSVWIRSAAYVLTRIGINHERHWDLLSEALLDDEEFVPFPLKDNKGETVGQFVEHLLAKDKYCNIALPRIPIATRKDINRRLALYRQFRLRYAANLEVIHNYRKPKVEVEVCDEDGEWSKGRTVGSTSQGERCVTTLVRFQDGSQHSVSLGMVIQRRDKGDKQAWEHEDLTCERGRSTHELMDQVLQEQRNAAVATGKDYFRGGGQVTVNPLGGVPIIAGVKRKAEETKEETDSEEEADILERRNEKQELLERQAKMASITSRYCVAAPDQKDKNPDLLNEPERMRLG